MKALLPALLLSFLLPGDKLLRQMGVQRSNQLPEHLEVDGSLTLLGDEARKASSVLGVAAQEPLTVNGHWSLSSGKCTLEARSTQKVAATNLGGEVTFQPPTAAQGATFAGWFTRLACLPFLFRGEASEGSLVALMKKAGADFDDVALTMERGEVAYVLGAGATGKGKVGLVLRKRGLVPLRVWEEENGARVDVVFSDYRPVLFAGGFPAMTELRVGGAAVERFVVSP